MNDVLADTNAIVWYLFDPPRLSPAADAALTAAAQSGTIYVSAITPIEINYVTGRRTFPYTGVLARLFALATTPNFPLCVLPVTLDVARALDRVPRAEVPDMPDRIIAATAVAHTLPVVTADADIRGSPSLRAIVPVVW